MGWEYAEADGRAIAIQRLLGYDCQQASAPFLDQSNLNLAYSYAEQPILYESRASVLARCLASAALVRPAAFDPTHEFAGIEVEVEYPEIFHISLPDEGLAWVAPGETTPKRATIHGLEVEGMGLRYVQVSGDANQICGLGLTHIQGIASFGQPATFRLQRSSGGSIRMTTDTGITFNEQWLGGPARRVEASALDRQWQDVTAHCTSGSIPTQLVQQWSDRNQRTLVDFRISV